MIKSEFKEIIEAFKKQPGQYTDEEIYKIGVAHKKLPNNDKDWAKLAKELGLNKSGNALRSWINHKQSLDGTLPKNINVLSDRTINDITNEDLTNKKEELFKQQQQTRDEWTAYRKLLREDARIDSLKSALTSGIETLKKLPKVTYKEIKNSNLNKESFLMLSDMHIGAYVDSFYNKYNVKTARARVQKVVKKTIKYCKQNNVKKLNILNLGDMIHGLIHITARIEEQIDVVDQIMIASEIIADALNQLQAAAPEVIYRSCTDNHSRMVADIKQSIEKENFGKLIDWFIEERLKNTKVKFVNDNLDDDIGLVTLMNGKKLVFVHGHRDKDFSRTILGISSKIGSNIDYLCLAHYHAATTKTLQNTLVFVNSSIMGSDTYASSIRLYGPASQTLLIFDDDDVINININLDNVRG